MPVSRYLCIFINVGLGEAAKRNVGTGANQIPDMGSFTLSVSGTGYQKLPSGFILQWGSIGAPGIAQDVVTHFPIAFPNRCLRVLVIKDLFGVSGQELQEIRTAIAGLQKGELIIKDQMAFALGMGNKYKKINVTHLI